jgi:dTDP-4-amino-4,6-dideoxygalactose transaminase
MTLQQYFLRWLSAVKAFSFWKGRVALYAILKSLNVHEGSEVIIPGYTCVMAVNPIKYLGAKPIYVDIEPVTYNMNVELLENKITSRTKVIIAQHTYGYPCDMDIIMEIARRYGIAVVEDCCLALGSAYKGKPCGTFGIASYFSFQWNKTITAGLGGLAIVNESDLAVKVEALCREELQKPSGKDALVLSLQRVIHRLLIYPRTTAFLTRLFRWLVKKGVVIGSSGACEYTPVMKDNFFMGMSNSQSLAVLKQLKRIENNMAHRRAMQQLYDYLLHEAGWIVSEIPEYIDPILVRYPIRVKDKARVVADSSRCGVEIGTWFESPLHPEQTPLHLYDYRVGMCPEAEKAAKTAINLPLHLRAGKNTVRRTVEFISNYAQYT